MAESLIPQVDFNRETIPMSVYDDPTQLFSAASRHAEAWVTDHIASPFKGTVDPLRANAVSRATGLFLGGYAERAKAPGQLIATTEAMGQWLADPLTNVPRHKSYPLPSSEVKRALFSKIITADWVNDYDALDPIVEGLGQLAMPAKDASAAAKSFAKNTKIQVEGDLRNALDDDLYLREKIVLSSAMTDRGIIDEGVWGKVGIGNFTPSTPLAITEEVHRRYVTERRDTFAPLNNRVLQGTLGKYALNVLKQAASGPNRDQAIIREAIATVTAHTAATSRIAENNILSISDEKVASVLIDYSNLKVDQAFFMGGEEQELLSYDLSSTGAALARVLYMARHNDAGQEAYSDNLHVEIMHEMATTDASRATRKPVWRPSTARGW